MASSSLTYRADIDGLRAIAILAVLLYHLPTTTVPGGFAGVDVFFVVSGFLITSVITKEVMAGNFSFMHFYYRRARRLLPSLVVCLFSTFVIGFYLLLPSEFRQLGKSVTLGSLFLSNFGSYYEAGYFDISGTMKPLLHLWSLGLEEQYYLIWPFILYINLQYPSKWFLSFTFLGALTSLSLNLSPAFKDSPAAFYLPQMRMWELLAGALIVPLQENELPSKLKDLLSWLGFLLCVLSFFGCIHWPLIPVTGAMLIIAAGPSAFLNRRFLGCKWLVNIGLISYPLYLWHWPLLSYLNIVYNNSPPLFLRSTAIVFSVVLAYASYRWIEVPIKRAPPKLIILILSTMIFILAGLGLLAYSDNLNAYSTSLSEMDTAIHDWDYPGKMKLHYDPAGNYYSTGNGPNEVVFIGDSHMQQYYPRVEKILEDSLTSKAYFFAVGGCLPIPGISSTQFESCFKFINRAFEFSQRKEVRSIVIAAQWSGGYFRNYGGRILHLEGKKFNVEYKTDGFRLALEELRIEISKLRSLGKKVYVVLNVPVDEVLNPRNLIERKFSLIPYSLKPQSIDQRSFVDKHPYLQALKEAAVDGGAKVIDPLKFLCENNQCAAMHTSSIPRYRDGSHLSRRFVRDYVTFLDETL